MANNPENNGKHGPQGTDAPDGNSTHGEAHRTEAVVRSRPCPVCQKMSVPKYRPFCSRRCADVDLARWLGGTYAIPARPQDEDDVD